MDNVDKALNILEKRTTLASDNVLKALWRQSSGNREKAYQILNSYILHYGIVINSFEFDCIVGELNDGVELEWNGDGTEDKEFPIKILTEPIF